MLLNAYMPKLLKASSAKNFEAFICKTFHGIWWNFFKLFKCQVVKLFKASVAKFFKPLWWNAWNFKWTFWSFRSSCQTSARDLKVDSVKWTPIIKPNYSSPMTTAQRLPFILKSNSTFGSHINPNFQFNLRSFCVTFSTNPPFFGHRFPNERDNADMYQWNFDPFLRQFLFSQQEKKAEMKSWKLSNDAIEKSRSVPFLTEA